MLARLLQFSIAHRVFVVIGAVVIAAIGFVAWQNLTLDAVPDITTNQVAVNTETGGMAPAEAERLVTFPIETAMKGIPGVLSVRSLSQYGLSQVTVTFDDSVDTYFARQLVNERLNNVKEQLPSGVAAPQMGPVSTGLGDIYMYAVESDERSPMDLRTLQDWVIAPQLRSVAGVAEVNAADGSLKQYQVLIDPQRLRARDLGIAQVVEALKSNNQNAGGGIIEQNGEQTIIRGVGLVQSTSDIESVVVASESGTPILIRDIGEVKLGVPTLTGISTKDGKQTMVSVVMMLKGANGRTVATAVDQKIQEIRQQLPKDVKLTTVYNRSDLVNEAVHTVFKSLSEGGALILLILLVFLGNWRSAVIVALLIPLSMLVAAIGMNRFGISGNLMSLGAIDFGLIVDGAVFMVENIVRRVSEKRSQKGSVLSKPELQHAVDEASREVARPVLFSVLIITVVYLPIIALEGTEGKTFKPMAYTVVLALLGALLLTMTLVPALAGMFLSRNTVEKHNPVMDLLGRLYKPALNWALRARVPLVAGSFALLAGAGLMFGKLGSEFIPTLDEGSLLVQPVRLRTVGVEETVKLVTAMEKKIKEVPEVVTVFSRSGTPEVASDPMPLSLTDSFIMLKPSDKWRAGMTKEKLREEIESKANEVPGQGYGFSQPIQMRFSELISGVKADIGIKVFGEDLDVLKAKADEIAKVVQSIPGASDVKVEQVDNIPVLQIDVDRSAIARLGVHIADVQELISVVLGGEPLGQVVEGDKRFELVVRLPASIRNDVDAIRALPVQTSTGGSVPLSTVAHIDVKPAPAQISRDEGKRRVVVQMNVRGSDMGTFVQKAQAAIKQQVSLPDGYYLAWGGQFENLQKASSRLMLVVPVALGLIFFLLYLSFGTAKQAVLIFTGIPLAVTGGVFALAMRGLPFSISAGVGFIALSGVAVLNGVVMVSAINDLRSKGLSIREAVLQGASERLRPILMTAMVAALGFIPMAVNTGIGAEVQRPLATVVIGGIVSATVLTLVVLPMLYAWFETERQAEVEV
ncbi:MAG: efflux RND transporter permease subunit [Nitrospira sp.]|nr:efflux RND transporter permease subunit [Nitrospira sp.]